MAKTLKYEFYAGTSLLKTVMDGSNQAYTEITQYTPQGKIEFLNHYNTTITNYIYDYATGRLSIIHSYNISQDIIDKNYTYSKAGDITQIINNRTDVTTTYYYDHLHRLISEQSSGTGAETGTSVEVIEFTYDEAGMPVHAPSQITNNGATTSYTYTSTGTRSNKIEGIETTTYVSNDDNMISQITVDGTTTNFYYNADNKRIKKNQDYASTLYFDQDFEIINGTFTLYVFAGNLRVAKVTDTTLEYYHKDHLGSTIAISRQDGTVIDFGEYLPYGLDRSNNDLLQTSAYKFTDQEQDDGTGLYNYDARLYDPVLGQFIMADTIVPDLFNPQSLNRYAYCLNNPVKYTDPSGHIGIPGAALGALGGAISGAISGAKGSHSLGAAIAGGFFGGFTGAITGGFVGSVLGPGAGGAAGGAVGGYVGRGISGTFSGQGFAESAWGGWGQLGMDAAVGAFAGWGGSFAGVGSGFTAAEATTAQGIFSNSLGFS